LEKAIDKLSVVIKKCFSLYGWMNKMVDEQVIGRLPWEPKDKSIFWA